MTQPHVAVFGSSQAQPGDPSYVSTFRLGALLAAEGVAVLNGGYAGLMEAVSRGASESGGHVIGITAPPVFPGRTGANEWISEERAHPTLTERIHDIVTLADATITVAGSLGTLTELLVAWNTAFVARFSGATPKPVIAVGAPWNASIPQLAEELKTDGSLVTTVETIEEAVDRLVRQLGLTPGAIR